MLSLYEQNMRNQLMQPRIILAFRISFWKYVRLRTLTLKDLCNANAC